MNLLVKKSVLCFVGVCVLGILVPSRGVGLVWGQNEWSGGAGQEFWKDSSMYYIGVGADPWYQPGELKLSRWSDCGSMNVVGVRSFCEIGDTLYAGAASPGVVYLSTDNGATWSRISAQLTDCQTVHFLLSHNDTIYAATSCFYGGAYHGKVFKIWNGGMDSDTTGTISAAEALFLLCVGDSLYAATGGTGRYAGKVFKSVDGFSWENIWPPDLDAEKIQTLLRATDGSIWAGGKLVNRGVVWRSTDGGRNWDIVTELDRSVNALVEDDAGAILAATSINGRIFKTVDNGATWDTVQLDPPGVLSLLKASDGSLFAGTSGSYVYRSFDSDTWTKTGYLSGVSIWDLFQASDSLIYAGTGGLIPAFRFGSYRESGWVESSKFDTRCNLEYGYLGWMSHGPPVITLKVRTSSHFDMDWEDIEPVMIWEDISGKSSVEDGDRFVQYLAELETSDPLVSPILDQVQLDFTTVKDKIPPTISTLPLTDTVFPGPFDISSIITDEPCCVEPESVYLYWSNDGWATENEIRMIQSGDTFSATVPRLSEGDSVWYYISACDLAWKPNFKRDPPKGADSSFAFWITPEPPRMVFFPEDRCIQDIAIPGPYRLNCKVWDEGDGVDESTVKLYWRYDWSPWQSDTLVAGAHHGFFGHIPAVPDPTVNTKVDYYIQACDVLDPPLCAQRPPGHLCTFYYIAAGDVGPLEILGLPEIVTPGFTYTPSALVANRGEDLVPSFDVICKVTDNEGAVVWNRNVQIGSSLSGGEIAFIQFPEWKVPAGAQDYWITVFTEFANDTIITNDTISLGVEVTVEEIAVSLPVPEAFGIAQNYPNPFSRFSQINYQVPNVDGGPVPTMIRVYDAVGKIVKILLNESKGPGYYTVSWDGTNGSGNPVPSGIYFYKINAGDFSTAKKMILVR